MSSSLPIRYGNNHEGVGPRGLFIAFFFDCTRRGGFCKKRPFWDPALQKAAVFSKKWPMFKFYPENGQTQKVTAMQLAGPVLRRPRPGPRRTCTEAGARAHTLHAPARDAHFAGEGHRDKPECARRSRTGERGALYSVRGARAMHVTASHNTGPKPACAEAAACGVRSSTQRAAQAATSGRPA